MKKQGEKEENWARSKTLNPGRNEATKFSDVPYVLMEEIFQKLPVKSLIRFKSVSKQWRSTIESQDFVERHIIQQKSRDPKILVTSSPRSGFFNVDKKAVPFTNLSIESISIQGEEEIYSSFTLSGHHFSDPLEVLESCDGLVCIYGMKMPIYILNPATRELRKLPPAHFPVGIGSLNAVDWRINHPSPVGFGRDINTGTYKVVQIFNWFDSFVALSRILTLDTGTWRHSSPVPYRICSRQKPVYAYGSLHWIATQNNVDKKILALDLHSEKFHLVQHPDGLFEAAANHMFTLRNRLCVLKRGSQWDLHIWAMDGDKRWEKIYALCLFGSTKHLYAYLLVRPLMVCEKERIVIKVLEDVLVHYLEKRDHRLLCTRKGAMAAFSESLVSPFR